MKRYFSTDGIRGRVGELPITADWVLNLGWAVGSAMTRKGSSRPQVLIGKDTRVSGYLFESALEAGLSSAGVDTWLVGPMPTPGIAYLTVAMRASVGIVISASHNPYYDNGIKFFASNGMKISDEFELLIEQQIEQPFKMVDSKHLGKAKRITDAQGRYVEFCKKSFPAQLDLRGIKVVVDCAHGATYRIAPNIFKELGAEVVEIGVAPNGFNINEGCGSTNPQLLQKTVLETQSDLGIAFDGDGDRVVMVDHQGNLLDGDDILYILARWYQDNQALQGGVVGTVMTNFGLECAFERLGIPFLRASVGDRHVMSMLQTQGWTLGGETSGHIICLDASTTGDGIVAALKVLSILAIKGICLHDLAKDLIKYPQVMINVPIETMIREITDNRILSALEQTRLKLKGRGRVLLRPSGTEPIIRVMVEGEDPNLVVELAEDLADQIRHSYQVDEQL